VFASFLEETLVSHGYQNGVSTIIGRASSHSDRFFLPRLPVNMFDDMQLFQAKLEGCYDWLHSVQWISKKFGHVVERIHTLAGRKGSPDEELSS